MPPPAALPDELAEEILILLSPEEAACLLRASLVCWAWRRLICHPDFLRRLYTLHRRAPLLGFFHGYPPRFAHTTASAFSLAVPSQRSWRVVDCRHGRVLLAAGRHLLVWEPITGLQRRLQSPSRYQEIGDFNAAVLCAAEGCDVALTASRLINAQYASELYNSTIAASHKGHVVAFSEDANAIFVSTISGVFSIELETERATKVYEADNADDFSRCSLVPFTSFYIPGKEAAVEEEPEEEPVSTLLHL